MSEPLKWGVEPLPEQRRYAEVMREVTSMVASLERTDPALLDLVETLEAARDKLAALVPADLRPRIGKHADGPGRVFVDHCRDIGAWNPMFPVYEIAVESLERATGTVSFPLCYEGPAGCVNGGMLALFFDQIVQHHNCDLGVSGATRDLDVVYRRPTPLLVDLDFEITRTIDERSVVSEARVFRDGELLCSVRTRAATFDSSMSPPVGARRLS